MKAFKWLLVSALLANPVQSLSADAQVESAGDASIDSTSSTAILDSTAADSTLLIADEEWLKKVWSQIDTLIQEEDFELQKTVVTGGVRGAEGEDLLVDQYYYFKGGKYYPNQQLVEQGIEALKKKLSRKPGKKDQARMKYLSALCYDIIGERREARDYYTQVVKKHSKSGYATKARERLEQLGEVDKPEAK